MIEVKEKVFHLKTAHYSYLFKINAYEQPEHLHFGVPVQTEDADSLSCCPGLGWGGSVLLEPGDTASCPDALPLEWSGSGRGDYRESPLEVSGVSTDFRSRATRLYRVRFPWGYPRPTAIAKRWF